MRSVAIAVIALAVAAAAARSSEQTAPPGEQEFRAAWLAFAAPTEGNPETQGSRARRQARVTALEHMKEAVEADPDNPTYQASLAHISLTAGRHALAKQAADRAIKLKGNDPLLHMLRGQAEAALAKKEPDKAGERIEQALKAFDRAARLDPKNALPLIQGASVAFDVGRKDLALPRIKEALGRPKLALYQLSVPFDLGPRRRRSIEIWQYVQYGYWMEMVAPCQNVSGELLRVGEEKMSKKDLKAAEAGFRDALALGRMVGMSDPNLFITAHVAINIMEDAYTHLLRIAEAKESGEADQWRGELGVLQIGRGELKSGLQAYLKKLDNRPPKTVQKLLDLEAEHVERTLLGIGLTPAAGRKSVPVRVTK